MRRYGGTFRSVAGWIRLKFEAHAQPNPSQEDFTLSPLLISTIMPLTRISPAQTKRISEATLEKRDCDEVAKLMSDVARATCVGGKKGQVFAHHARVKLISEVMKRFEQRGDVSTLDVRIGIVEILNDRQAGQFALPHHNAVDSMCEVVLNHFVKQQWTLLSPEAVEYVETKHFKRPKRRHLTQKERINVCLRRSQRKILRRQGIHNSGDFLKRMERHKVDELTYLAEIAWGHRKYQTPKKGQPALFNPEAASILLRQSWHQAAIVGIPVTSVITLANSIQLLEAVYSQRLLAECLRRPSYDRVLQQLNQISHDICCNEVPPSPPSDVAKFTW